jgi:uncharacterized delta-60 repeat protein
MDQALAAALQSDGKIVAAGFATSIDGISQNFAVARYTSSGVLDAIFNNRGMQQIDFGSCCQSAYQVLMQSDGIVTVGFLNSESSDSDFLLARLKSTGLSTVPSVLAAKCARHSAISTASLKVAFFRPMERLWRLDFKPHPAAEE